MNNPVCVCVCIYIYTHTHTHKTDIHKNKAQINYTAVQIYVTSPIRCQDRHQDSVTVLILKQNTVSTAEDHAITYIDVDTNIYGPN